MTSKPLCSLGRITVLSKRKGMELWPGGQTPFKLLQTFLYYKTFAIIINLVICSFVPVEAYPKTISSKCDC